MSRLSLLIKGTVTSALMLSVCLVSYAQMPGGNKGPKVHSTVVAGVAGEIQPVTKKKYVGNVEAIEEVDSVARVSGILTVAPDFQEGSHVSKGQLLFEIDPVPYQAKVDAAEASIKQLEAKIAYAQSNFDRVSKLYDRNAGSQNDMESANSELLSLQAQLLAAQAQLTLAKEDLSYTKIYSMIDGRAGRRSYSSGNYVTPSSQSLVKVVQMNPIYVRFTMSERDYMSMYENFEELKTKSSLELRLPNDKIYPLEGKISFIDNSVKSTTDTVKIWATFENPDEILSPGGVVTVNLAKKSDDNVAAIDPPAVLFDGKTNYVYILVDTIDQEKLFEEIKNDPRFAKDMGKIESGETTKEDFMASFLKEHYESVDPVTNEPISEYADGKVQEGLLMVLRRDVKLGPSNGKQEAVLEGVEIGETVMMDGVNKARPFDLVKPVYRSKEVEKAPEAKENAEKTDAPKAAPKAAPKDAKTAKNVAKKNRLASASLNLTGVCAA